MLQFNKKELSEALDAAMVAVQSKTSIPVLQCVSIKASGAVAWLRCTDLNFEAVTRAAVLADSDEEIVLPAAKLRLACQGKGDTVSIEQTENSVLLKCGAVKLKCEKTLPANFPAPSGYDLQLRSAGRIKGSALKDLMRTVAGAADDGDRYALHNVSFAVANGRAEAAATNAHVLLMASVSCELLPFTALIPKPTATRLCSILADREYEIEYHENLIKLTDTDNGDTFTTRTGQGAFPNYKMILNDIRNPEFVAGVEGLREAAKLGAEFYGTRKAGNGVVIDCEEKAVKAISGAEEFEIADDAIAQLKCGKKKFDPAYISKAISWIDGDLSLAVDGSRLAVRGTTLSGVECLSVVQEMRM